MDRATALLRLKSIQKPILLDGGYSKVGRTFFVLIDAGLITVDCRIYDPIIGPIEFSLDQYAEIKEIARESLSLAESDDLDPDEKLFLFNNGKPGVPYWAFQPHDEAALGEYLLSADKTEIEQAFVEQSLSLEVEAWDAQNDASLRAWAGKIVS
ncbi:hypothetical protein [Chlorobium phaeobacteroides]|jgi:hypothetical protein|uniref:Uncharacterized protein n=1 Tax=Chlorobium phaeobacteroides (strain DSM 266 / SMG 266 / 2430) TaxID=290317 RepID=A1BHX1_CHLPD|nr:hypothetical protein [Chlorobium phaeobacteroides]ABL65998.1 hypothetical protein Cpha266_1985 [Chlorobium phaeobacteroides DSM 266]MBV5328563.1 hypothetical protein [Chlorobium sp.]